MSILRSEQTPHDQLYILKNDHYLDQANPRKLNHPFNSVMCNFDIIGSCDGFLCLTDLQAPDATYIYNPVTHESIQLPPIIKHFSHQRVVLGFGFDPLTKEYKVVQSVYCLPSPHRMEPRLFGHTSSDTSVHTLGSDSWRSLGKRASHLRLDWRSPAALVNGFIHWLTQAYKYKQFHEIVAFDFATEVFYEVPYPSCPSFRRNMYSLVELGGRLCAVVDAYCNGKIDMWVMKEYNVASSWSKDYIVGGLNPDLKLPRRMRDKWFNTKSKQVLCLLETGEILFACYDPEKEEFRDLNLHGLTNCFESVVLRGSLTSFQFSIYIKS